MSVIRVDNFGPSAGGTTYSARGIAQAWVNFNGTGTIAARDSENVSSLTDNGTGDFRINFSNSMVDADYTFSAECQYDEGGNAQGDMNLALPRQSGAIVAASLRLFAHAISNNASSYDQLRAIATIHGDLA